MPDGSWRSSMSSLDRDMATALSAEILNRVASIRLMEGLRVLVSLPYPALRGQAVASGIPTHWEGRTRDGHIVIFGDATDELIATATRIERGMDVTITDFGVQI